jgi:hypothetical protein
VLLRKAALVLIGVLLSNAVGQAVAVVVFFTLLTVAHTRMLPYTSHMFNVVEGASMLCVIVTAALGLLSTGSQSTKTVLVATILMLGINFAMLYILLHVLLKEHLTTLCSNSRVAACVARVRTKPLTSSPPPALIVRHTTLLDKKNERGSALEQVKVRIEAEYGEKGLPSDQNGGSTSLGPPTSGKEDKQGPSVRPKLTSGESPHDVFLDAKPGLAAMDRRLAPLQSRASQRFIRPVRASVANKPVTSGT